MVPDILVSWTELVGFLVLGIQFTDVFGMDQEQWWLSASIYA